MMVLPPRVLFSLEDEREKNADDDGKKLFIVVEDIVCLFFFLYMYTIRDAFVLRAVAKVKYVF